MIAKTPKAIYWRYSFLMDVNKFEDFSKWLQINRGMQKRSAQDIISRRRKLLELIPDPSKLTLIQIESLLKEEFSKGQFSKATLSAMVRSEKLFRKFIPDDIKN
jgi:hypothetical protein